MDRRNFLKLGTAAAVAPALTNLTPKEAEKATEVARNIGYDHTYRAGEMATMPSMHYGSCTSVKGAFTVSAMRKPYA